MGICVFQENASKTPTQICRTYLALSDISCGFCCRSHLAMPDISSRNRAYVFHDVYELKMETFDCHVSAVKEVMLQL